MSSYTSRLQRHLKNHAKQLRYVADTRHSEALDIAAADFGFSGWKQATAHMAMAEIRIRGAQASFASEVARLAAELRVLPGYPYRLEDRTGVRFEPADKQQTEAVAKRLVLLQLFEDIHAPKGLCHSVSARLWFRAPMLFDDAAEICQRAPWKIRRLSLALMNEPKASENSWLHVQPPTPEVARITIIEYLHALHSISVIRSLTGSPEEVVGHPGFKEFAGFALNALLAGKESKEALLRLLDHAGISGWVKATSSLIDPKRLYWVGRQESESLQSNQGVSMVIGPALHPRLRRPLNSLSHEKHEEISTALARVGKLVQGKAGLERNLSEIRETLAGWMALEIGGQERANKCYFSMYRAYRPVPFLAPAEEVSARTAIQTIRDCIEAGYENCMPRSRLLTQVIQLQKKFDRWMEKTEGHWLKTSHKLPMDSIGLVAIDPKHELSLDSESVWKQTTIMGGSREADLIAAVRPLLFKSWREEEEGMGYDFNAADPDSEQSILEHLHDLAFYRYTGAALTRAQYEKEVRKAFYFEPEHVWFKQRKIR
ncbi:DUF5623 domain-containing protein [Pseudomonas aeruginosa]|uniref:DUF5623 domain-containing protein n=1 Tax=Pseudomonas aeruginosa TaxID=287 RepID=UPI00053E2C31|nr:DUF5623 domain-containing protein [Pseudomonas aeruginosa]AWZ84312.1 hypothetical protein CSC41_5939 [Pseudomonas aeruginosa]KSN52989.1 hypothetical protein APA86_25610 [Pseudomonas aeruginosa]MBG4519968.1 DUF5623 domain-containing protein [Pseudomonas aeruginosa]MBG5829065.1 DUF5623 domain-containing protein [Pseudomonas aeruginosa]MCO2349170.1 hypothetical protein [Pseudomonas aeruginosa]